MAVLYSILFLCVIFSSGTSLRRHGHEKLSGGKIVGGYDTTIEQFPYQTYLLLQSGTDYFQCGGSIISTRAVLTAAHCLVGIQRVYVRIGSTDSNSGGTEYSSSSLFIHPMYNARTSDYDVGMIIIPTKMKLDNTTSKIVPIASRSTTIPAGSDTTVSGWGTTSEGGETSSTLMAVTVPAISNEECSMLLSGITSRMFCAGEKEGGKDSCQGDSGGPAVNSNGTQIGIVSFGIGCARPDLPGVYTRISAVRTWIKMMSGV